MRNKKPIPPKASKKPLSLSKIKLDLLTKAKNKALSKNKSHISLDQNLTIQENKQDGKIQNTKKLPPKSNSCRSPSPLSTKYLNTNSNYSRRKVLNYNNLNSNSTTKNSFRIRSEISLCDENIKSLENMIVDIKSQGFEESKARISEATKERDLLNERVSGLQADLNTIKGISRKFGLFDTCLEEETFQRHRLYEVILFNSAQ